MHNQSRFITVLMLVVALAAAVSGCGPKGDGASRQPSAAGEAGTGSAEAPTGSVPVDGSSSASTQGVPSAGQPGGTGGVQGGASGNGSGNGQGSSGSATGAAQSGSTRTLKVLWWNDTASRTPKSPEIVFGGKSFKPRAGKRDSGSIGPIPLDRQVEVVVYPDGRSGPKLVAEILVDKGMTSNSDTDAIHVEVRDTGVRVLGNPVVDFTQSFSRP